MFNCGGACSGNPFSLLFSSPAREEDADDSVSVGSLPSVRSEDPLGLTPPPTAATTASSRGRFTRLVESWLPLVHPRVHESWGAGYDTHVRRLLHAIAQNAAGDPIMTDEDCVLWKGDVDRDNHHPVVLMYGAKKHKERVTFVRRALAFLFVNDESYAALCAVSAKGPVDSECKNALCVNIRHVLIDD